MDVLRLHPLAAPPGGPLPPTEIPAESSRQGEAAILTEAERKDAKLHQASADFAAVLYSQVFSQMRPSEDDQDEDSLFSGGSVSMFMPYLDQAVGQKMAEGSGNVLAEQLYQQLTRNRDQEKRP